MKVGAPSLRISVLAIALSASLLAAGCNETPTPSWVWCTEIRNAHLELSFGESGGNTSPIGVYVALESKEDLDDESEDGEILELDTLEYVSTQADAQGVFRSCVSSDHKYRYTREPVQGFSHPHDGAEDDTYRFADDLAWRYANGEEIGTLPATSTHPLGSDGPESARDTELESPYAASATFSIRTLKDGSLLFLVESDRAEIFYKSCRQQGISDTECLSGAPAPGAQPPSGTSPSPHY